MKSMSRTNTSSMLRPAQYRQVCKRDNRNLDERDMSELCTLDIPPYAHAADEDTDVFRVLSEAPNA